MTNTPTNPDDALQEQIVYELVLAYEQGELDDPARQYIETTLTDKLMSLIQTHTAAREAAARERQWALDRGSLLNHEVYTKDEVKQSFDRTWIAIDEDRQGRDNG